MFRLDHIQPADILSGECYEAVKSLWGKYVDLQNTFHF